MSRGRCAEVGLAVLRDGHCRLRHYRRGANDDIVWGFGLGCDATVEILVQPLTRNTRGALSRVRELLDGDRPFAVSTVLSGDAAGRIVLVDPDGVGDDSPARLDLPARLGLEVAARNKNTSSVASRRSGVTIPRGCSPKCTSRPLSW